VLLTLNIPAGRFPQLQDSPETLMFSFVERLHVHAPAALWLHEHRAPEITFSVFAFSQLQCRAFCLPHEQVASAAQMHPPSRPQQVAI